MDTKGCRDYFLVVIVFVFGRGNRDVFNYWFINGSLAEITGPGDVFWT